MILSCVVRVKEKLGYYVGKTLIVQTLRASRDQRVLALGLDGLSTYGLMRTFSAGQVREIIDFLELEGYLYANPLHSTLEPTKAASAVLFHGQKLFMPVREDQGTLRRRRKGAPVSAAEETEDLFSALKAVRTQIAQEENVPAYIVFSNATLMDMADKAPDTIEELLEVSGVGEVKAARYGVRFLEAIAAYKEENEHGA
jgi:ATP-dependent DNA helicase RecQ